MSQFEFFMIIASVLVAIAITEVVGWWGRLLRTGRVGEVGNINLAWSLLFICNIVLYWSGFWAYVDVDVVNFAQIWMLLLPTLFLVLVAFAITPEGTTQSFSFKVYYEKNRKLIFFGWTLFILGAVIADAVMFQVFDWAGAMPGLVIAGLFLVCAFVKHKVFDYVAIVALFLLIFVFPVVLGFEGALAFFVGKPSGT
jgi:hypothetical protein